MNTGKTKTLVWMFAIIAWFSLAGKVLAATYTVTKTADTNDGTCDADCSLREAITATNANAGTDTIDFNIPTSDSGYRDFADPGTPSSGNSSGGDDYWTIQPGSALPTISETTILDATTQTSSQGDTNTNGPEIEIKGTGTAGIRCLVSVSTNTVIKGFVINNCSQGVVVNGTNPTISSNYIGVDIKGTTMISNQTGIEIQNTTNGLIGGLNPTDRNIIAGNISQAITFSGNCGSPTSGVNIYNNYLNVDRTGTAAIIYNSSSYGIYAAMCKTNNNVGNGTAAGRNLIAAGNYGIQLQIQSNNWHIKGNYFGLAADGTTLLSPVYALGIAIDSGSFDNVVGGVNPGDRNYFVDATFATIWIWDNQTTSGNQVLNNYIGADINGNYAGTTAIYGVMVGSGSTCQNNVIGQVGAGNLIKAKGGVTISGAINTTVAGNTITGSAGAGISFGGTITGNLLTQNLIYSNTGIGINVSGGTEDSHLVTANDAGDTDTGANLLMNYPQDVSVEFVGGGYYKVSGVLDGNSVEAPFTIEICLSENDPSGHGGCTQYLGSTTTSDYHWETNVYIGDEGNRDHIFTTLATNSLNDTSEYSANAVFHGSSSSSSSSNTSIGNNSCNDLPPNHAPDLFQVTSGAESAVVYFSPVRESNYYFISYGLGNDAQSYGVVYPTPYQDGVIFYQVKDLDPKTTYHFKVRAGNGCATGNWSRVLSVKTDAKKSRGGFIYYAYSKIVKKISGFKDLIRKI